MTLAEVPLVVALIGLIAYAVLAGADFGAGFWQLMPGDDERERTAREFAHDAITPVWEANHVWLILVLTVVWTCYPSAFAAVASTLALPLTIAALGIVFRAIAYLLQGQLGGAGSHRAVEGLFALSSIMVPFALGAAAGGIASGRVPPGNAQGDLITSWLNPTSIAIGLVAVASTAYISAVWLTADAARADKPELCEIFRTRALWAAVVSGAIACVSLLVVRSDAEELWHGLTTWPGIAAVIVSAIAGVAALALVAARRLEPARVVSVAAVAAIIAGWALAQRPELLPPSLTISQAAAGRSTLIATLIGLAVGSLILIPSLGMLFHMVLGGTFSAAPAPTPLAQATRAPLPAPARWTSLCIVGLAAGALVLVVGDAAWSLALGASLLLIAGAVGFVIVARSLTAAA